jgi:hypothetical protein
MTDEIKKHPNWWGIVASLGGVLGVGWAIMQWAATTPTRKEFNDVRDDMIRVRIELPIVTGKIERMEQSQSRIEKTAERIEAKQDEATRRRSRPRVDERP